MSGPHSPHGVNPELAFWGEKERDRLLNRGFARSITPGNRPAVVVIDLSAAFTDERSPVGGNLDNVVAATAGVLEVARSRGFPVFFTSQAFLPDMSDAGIMYLKQPAVEVLKVGTPEVDIDERLGRREGEPVIFKKAASAFFGTNLASMLIQRSVDTLILAGCSTSGCVRATAIDAYSYHYRLLVPRECVGDRTPQAHAANLFDIQVKMGEVVSKDDVVAYLRRVEQMQE